MSPVIGVISGIIQGFPRVSGDEPHSTTTLTAALMFSPRERG